MPERKLDHKRCLVSHMGYFSLQTRCLVSLCAVLDNLGSAQRGKTLLPHKHSIHANNASCCLFALALPDRIQYLGERLPQMMQEA